MRKKRSAVSSRRIEHLNSLIRAMIVENNLENIPEETQELVRRLAKELMNDATVVSLKGPGRRKQD